MAFGINLSIAIFLGKTALGAFYRRIRSRSGAPEAGGGAKPDAMTATAHQLARIFDRLWVPSPSRTSHRAIGVGYREAPPVMY